MASYVGYIALKEHFPKMALKPNPECTSFWCRKQQARQKVRDAEAAAAAAAAPPAPPAPPPAELWHLSVAGDAQAALAGVVLWQRRT